MFKLVYIEPVFAFISNVSKAFEKMFSRSDKIQNKLLHLKGNTTNQVLLVLAILTKISLKENK